MQENLHYVRLQFNAENMNEQKPTGFVVETRKVINEHYNQFELETPSGLGRSYAWREYEFKNDSILSLEKENLLPHFVTDPSLIPTFKKHILDHFLFERLQQYETAVKAHDFFIGENNLRTNLTNDMVHAFSLFREQMEQHSLISEDLVVYCSIFRHEDKYHAKGELMWITDENLEENTYELTDYSHTPCTDVSRNIGELELGNHTHPFASVCVRLDVDVFDTVTNLLESISPFVRQNVTYEKTLLDTFIQDLQKIKI